MMNVEVDLYTNLHTVDIRAMSPEYKEFQLPQLSISYHHYIFQKELFWENLSEYVLNWMLVLRLIHHLSTPSQKSI